MDSHDKKQIQNMCLYIAQHIPTSNGIPLAPLFSTGVGTQEKDV